MCYYIAHFTTCYRTILCRLPIAVFRARPLEGAPFVLFCLLIIAYTHSVQAGLAITFLGLSTQFWASSRVLSVLTCTTVPTIAYGRSLRIDIFTLTGRGGHTTHHHKVPQRQAHKHTENITQAARLAAESIS